MKIFVYNKIKWNEISNTFFLILFKLKSSVSKSNIENYSLTLFIDKLKGKDTFELVQSIKEKCSQDVAIIWCQELNENQYGNCKS